MRLSQLVILIFRLLFIVTLCFGYPQQTAEVDPVEELNAGVYENRSHGFQLTVPTNWRLDTGTRRAARAVGALVTSDGSANVTIFRDAPVSTIEQYIEELDSEAKRLLNSFEKISETEIVIDGNAGIQSVYRTGMNESSRLWVRAVFRESDAVTRISGRISQSQQQTLRPIVESIINSYRSFPVTPSQTSVGTGRTATTNAVSVLDSPTLPPGVLRVGGEIMSKNLVKSVEPTYPLAARQRGIKGTVRLIILISETGSVEEIKVVYGEPILVESAKAAISQWQYKPTSVQGRAVRIVTVVEVNFR
jgi:TonB family protein